MSLLTAIQGAAAPAGPSGGSATLYAEPSDGLISSSDDKADDYSIARNGTGVKTLSGGAALNVGQNKLGAEYIVIEAFLNFDVSSVAGAAATAALSLWLTSDGSTTDFTIQARTNDWGDTLTTGDFVPGGDLAGKTLLASVSTAGISTGAYITLTESGTALRDAIDAAVAGDGMLRLVICSSRTTDNNAPTGSEVVTFSSSDEGGTSQDPKLTVAW